MSLLRVNAIQDATNETVAIDADVAPTTSALRIRTIRPAWAYADLSIVNVTVFD